MTTSPTRTFSTKSLLKLFLFDLDTATFAVALFGTIIAHLLLSKDTAIRPFFPQDATLWYNHKGDSIHTTVLFLIYDFIIAPLIFICEQARLSTYQHLSRNTRRKLAFRFALGMWTATMLAVVFVEFGKGYVGGLRPSFARACLGPDNTPSSYSQPIFSDAECVYPESVALRDKRRSFPSGHAALGLGGAAYTQLYILYAMRRYQGPELVATSGNLLGWIVMAFGAWVAASRIVDSAHHVGDVAVGAIVGLWTAAMHFWFISGRNALQEDVVEVRQATRKNEAGENGSDDVSVVTEEENGVLNYLKQQRAGQVKNE